MIFSGNLGDFLFLTLSLFIPFLLLSLPCFKFLSPFEAQRIHVLDGLRGMAAWLVVLNHGACSFHWHKTGILIPETWNPNVPFVFLMDQYGGTAVALFFMLSAFLFWGRECKTSSDWGRFYTKRLFRLLPAAFFSAIIMVVLITTFGEFLLDPAKHPAWDGTQSEIELVKVYAGWIFSYIGLPFGHNPEWLGLYQTHPFMVNAKVHWTLFYEWMLYFSLPILFSLRRLLPNIVLPITLILYAIAYYYKIHPEASGVILCFSIGFLASEWHGKIILSKRVLNWIALFSLCAAIGTLQRPAGWSVLATSLIGLFFCAIIWGGDLWGLLTSTPLIRLGEISYSVYLLHGIIWFVAHRTAHQLSLPGQWVYLGNFAILPVILLLASLSFYLIEAPGMRLGKKISQKIFPQQT